MSTFRFVSGFVVCFQLLVFVSCAPISAHTESNIESKKQYAGLKAGTTLERITNRGGRIAWYKGSKHELIAFDAIVDWKTLNTEVYTMKPDGTQRHCVTCFSGLPKGFVGQPVWHPDGEHIVVQAENSNSRHTRFNHVSFGFDNDLWIVRRDGSGAERIYSTPLNHAALHPHFSKSGTKIVFAERVPTGKSYRFLRKRTPGGENHWDGWQIHIADFDINKRGGEKLSNHRILFKGKGGFFETHGFTKDGRIVYSHTVAGKRYVDDIYVANDDGTGVKRIINSPETWDEHGLYSPSGGVLAFNSSRGDASWKASRSKPTAIKLDLYLRTQAGEIQRLTDMNALISDGNRYVTSDFDWDRTGKRIAFQVAPFTKGGSPEIWILTFAEPQ